MIAAVETPEADRFNRITTIRIAGAHVLAWSWDIVDTRTYLTA